ncbi:homeobox-leucine zipper protein ATHB-22-like [Trifolium pratense]|uniref:homeobox-leucine zipper protein ATHB-22-like n=1 Tax=Trifolium pratense TaxID=57577 RepID=UPI001E690EE3|nr:homeobox-leucine zipper protein ATHB-22-like [Trifolium pratense]
MDWNIESTRPFVPHAESSLSFFYNYNNTPYSGMDVSQAAMGETQQRLLPAMDEMNINGNNYKEKKKRLTSNQIDLLERSFQEEIKLDPERKIKLSRELGLQPRQIAVWFQNRRTRWKAKHLEHLYDVLKQEFDVVSKEKQKLQEEVMKLKGKLKEQSNFRTQQTFVEETVESTSKGLRCSNKPQGGTAENYTNNNNVNSTCFTVEDFNNPVSMPPQQCHWPVLPNYYP